MKKINLNNETYYFNSNTFNLSLEKSESSFFPTQEADPTKIDKVVLNIANACNLKCVYCYAEGGNYGSINRLMSQHTIESIIENLKSQGVKSINRLIIFGGEPFLNWNGFKYTVKKALESFEVNRIETVTNGTRVSKDKLNFIIDNNIFVTVSLDGPNEVHEMLRGKETYDKIISFITGLQERNYKNFEVAGTYTHKHEKLKISKEDLRDFYERLEVKYNISEVFSKDKELMISRKMNKQDILNDIDNSVQYILNGECEKYVNPILYDLLLSMIYKKRSVNFCDDLSPSVGLAYDIDGSLKSCFRFWGNEEGETAALYFNEKENFEECKECWCRNMCKECPANAVSGFYVNSELGMNNKECVKKEYFEHAIKKIIPLNRGELTCLVNNFNEFLHYA